MKITPPTARDLRRITCPSKGDKIVKQLYRELEPAEMAKTCMVFGSVFLLNKIFKSQGMAAFYSIKEPAGLAVKQLPMILELIMTKFSSIVK